MGRWQRPFFAFLPYTMFLSYGTFLNSSPSPTFPRLSVLSDRKKLSAGPGQEGAGVERLEAGEGAGGGGVGTISKAVNEGRRWSRPPPPPAAPAPPPFSLSAGLFVVNLEGGDLLLLLRASRHNMEPPSVQIPLSPALA
ncbi:uncharacterized protein LY79DRAFT_236847 [Colletotrichum navitas]|uniref:Uncharacterized protein n=1 Tax=Colletotrichum navitas TaxID=681940 RepID=A0AAD8PX02_9PEZI|nr:uncharacterized protein LY79DRAFT_236847 [Colletotrichum navitas]KAK1589631.1 hypothetical protein LY79DRAFT_236847 [Colletotrichum navitas]